MLSRKATLVTAFALLVAGGTAAMAQNEFTPPATPEEAVSMRQALMKEDGGIVRTLGNLSGADAAAALTTIRDNYKHIPALFPEGSIVGNSEALPAIWENWETFTGIVDAGIAAAETGIAAAEAGDTAGYQSAVRSLMGTCGQCHQQFRS